MAEQRKYSVSEIDDMRASVKQILTPVGMPYIREDIENKIEPQLRTYMLNGTTPDELREAAQIAMKAHVEAAQERKLVLMQRTFNARNAPQPDNRPRG